MTPMHDGKASAKTELWINSSPASQHPQELLLLQIALLLLIMKKS